MRKGWWKTRRGKYIKIKDMKTVHIYNTIRFLTGCQVCDPVYNKSFTDKEMVKHVKYLNSKCAEMVNEYHKRIKKEAFSE